MAEKSESTEISIVHANIFGDVCLRKQRRKRQKLLVTELLYDFARNSTLHGLRNITDAKLSLIERAFWLVTFIMSVCICFYLMSNVWVKWRTSPVIVTVSEELVSVGKVPFPSVTICPQTKCDWTIYNYTSERERYHPEFRNDSDIMRSADAGSWVANNYKFEDVRVVCNYDLLSERPNHYVNRSTANVTLVNTIMEISQQSPLISCKWRNHSMRCEDLFDIVLTREGVCYTMNTLAANEIFKNGSVQQEYNYSTAVQPSKSWMMDKGYIKFDPNAYPRRGRDSSGSVDLSVTLIENREHADKSCNNLNSGYKIYLHHPADMPQSSIYYYSALPSKKTALAININILNTSRSLQGYTSDIRQCYFPDDRPLRYFQIYTANNCRIECLSNFTYKMCDCVWFHMPHNDSMELCPNERKRCVIAAAEILADEEIKLISGANNTACQCLPSCDSVEYDAEVLKTAFNLETALKIKYKDIDTQGFEFSSIQLYFKKPRYVSMRRSELFGITDFLANCGGLLGLFLGFSFLSLVEIFYYLTLRIGCMLKKDLEDEKMERNMRQLKIK